MDDVITIEQGIMDCNKELQDLVTMQQSIIDSFDGPNAIEIQSDIIYNQRRRDRREGKNNSWVCLVM